jgi:hypothetical protein
VKDPLSYARTICPKSSGHGKIPAPSPDSPFYVPPPSSKALRWAIVFCLIGPSLFASAAFESALARVEWTGLVIAPVMLCAYSMLEWVRIRAILRELARRHAGGSGGRSGNPTTPGGTDDEAEEAARRRKAAWARARHDVFPILSNPSVLKRPFDTWDDWKD